MGSEPEPESEEGAVLRPDAATGMAPELAELGELKTVLESGNQAQLDAMLVRLQAENDALAQG